MYVYPLHKLTPQQRRRRNTHHGHEESNTDRPICTSTAAMALFAEYSSQELLQSQLQLWHQSLSLGFFKSLALAVAMDLRIADAIHRLGGAATLPQILTEAGINNLRSNKFRDRPVTSGVGRRRRRRQARGRS